ncbi:hypothetical protein [Aliiglaciecola sp. M165]|uniref:hypothetical protein n=1 Tax=Aliiglaciecola sp. M165 TaxID=2593649 RepID=UPI00117E35F6|nr:hypothetical protein [Aliiglaciecola sp. M165]TRY29309.1 hypothetical protein FM019_18055 [Aliiglaciecola sp. M165]
MSFLLMLFTIKIIVSIFFVVLPFTQANANVMRKFTTLQGDSNILFHLYATAIVALLVSYGFGAYHAYQQYVLVSSVYVGIVSNGGASAILLMEYFKQGERKSSAQMASPISIIVFGAIFVGCVFSAIWPKMVIAPF